VPNEIAIQPRIELREHGRAASEPIAALVARLARLDCSPFEVVSLYLDARWSDEQQRERVWLTVRERVRRLSREKDDPRLREDLDAALHATESWVRQASDVGYAGLALFRGVRVGLDVTVRAHVPFATSVTVGPLPLVRPLALLTWRQRAIVALADSTAVQVYELALGRLRERERVVGDVERKTKRGGWAQLKLQHHREERGDALHRAAAASIARAFDETAPDHVLIGGRAEAAPNLLRLVPVRVRAVSLLVDELDTERPPHEILAAVEPVLEEAAIVGEQQLIAEIEGQAASSARGALGLQAVIYALNAGRPYRMLVAPTLDRPLRRCSVCGVISLDMNSECAACGGRTHLLEALEALSRAALALDARLTVAKSGILDERGGAAALLRF
jgi:peptide subunit release factor 1 (eRF1)